MSNVFLEFKERQNKLRLIKTAMIGGASGVGVGGLCLIFTKLDLLGIAPIFSLPIGIAALLIAGVVAYFALAESDRQLARELDERFDLKEKVQTMLAFEGEGGDMLALQRADANVSLSAISVSELKIKKIWIYITALAVAAAILLAGFLVPNIWKKNQNPPYRLTEYQEAGVLELIRYVDASGMEEQYRVVISQELRVLLDELRRVDNERAMRAALAKSMAVICSTTYESSNSTEILNLLWDTEDKYLRYLAKWLDTSSSYDEGDFAERLIEYQLILVGEEESELTEEERKTAISQALDGMVRKYKIGFENADIPKDDGILLALNALFYSEEEGRRGLSHISAEMADMDYTQAREEVIAALYGVYEEMYAAILKQKTNTNVGEYTMTRLSSLFSVPAPEFERTDFVRTGESVEGNRGDSKEDDNNGGKNDGGIGEGATFGSDDLVLDPLTGKYVKYGELIDTYYGVMYEKLENGSYTEEQKEMILKYFALLYSGLEEEEGK